MEPMIAVHRIVVCGSLIGNFRVDATNHETAVNHSGWIN